MNRSDETLFDPQIASWLEADPNTAPEPVLEVVLAALPAIKQRRAWRVPLVPAIPRTLLAQATLVGMVLLAVVVGFGVWYGGRNLVVPPGASPTPISVAHPIAVPVTGGDALRNLRHVMDRLGTRRGRHDASVNHGRPGLLHWRRNRLAGRARCGGGIRRHHRDNWAQGAD